MSVRALLSILLLAACLGLGACDDDDDCPLTILDSTLPDGSVGFRYEYQLEADCGGDEWFLLSSLPPGMQFADDGLLSGTPTTAGDYVITVEVVEFPDGFDDDSEGEQRVAKSLAWKVN